MYIDFKYISVLRSVEDSKLFWFYWKIAKPWRLTDKWHGVEIKAALGVFQYPYDVWANSELDCNLTSRIFFSAKYRCCGKIVRIISKTFGLIPQAAVTLCSVYLDYFAGIIITQLCDKISIIPNNYARVAPMVVAISINILLDANNIIWYCAVQSIRR